MKIKPLLIAAVISILATIPSVFADTSWDLVLGSSNSMLAMMFLCGIVYFFMIILCKMFKIKLWFARAFAIAFFGYIVVMTLYTMDIFPEGFYRLLVGYIIWIWLFLLLGAAIEFAKKLDPEKIEFGLMKKLMGKFGRKEAKYISEEEEVEGKRIEEVERLIAMFKSHPELTSWVESRCRGKSPEKILRAIKIEAEESKLEEEEKVDEVIELAIRKDEGAKKAEGKQLQSQEDKTTGYIAKEEEKK